MEHAFLQSIIENPEDLAHRLIFADCLDEQGNADRAEFIRLQCGNARTQREKELLNWHWERWSQPIRNIIPRLTRNDICYRHGFPFRITFRRADDLEHLPLIMKIVPIREIDLNFDGNENAIFDRQFYDVFFTDGDTFAGSSIRRVRIRSEQEQRRLDKIFETLRHGNEIRLPNKKRSLFSVKRNR
jgi:uncharacterized protein (TIGR02996 family)